MAALMPHESRSTRKYRQTGERNIVANSPRLVAMNCLLERLKDRNPSLSKIQHQGHENGKYDCTKVPQGSIHDQWSG